MVHAGDARTLARKSIHIIMSQPYYTYIEPLKLIDYSPKCIAIVGDTKQVKDELKALGDKMISDELKAIPRERRRDQTADFLKRLEAGERDLRF